MAQIRADEISRVLREEIENYEGAIDVSTWWQHLGDATLTDLIATAVRSSPDVASARAKLREVRARRRLAAADLWPTIGASVSAQDQTSSGLEKLEDLYDVGFDASWEPDLVGGTRRAVEAATADEDASRNDLRAAGVTVAGPYMADTASIMSMLVSPSTRRGSYTTVTLKS